MPEVFVKFPKTGLGNMLLVWARAVVFASMNNLEYSTSPWWGLRWGALLRREQRKRLYYGYFTETGLLKRLSVKLYSAGAMIVREPAIEIILPTTGKKTLYVFNKVCVGEDLFGTLRDHSVIVAAELDIILHPRMKILLGRYRVPEVAIHIRRGDFKLGNQTTAISHFINGIQLIRSVTKKNIAVTVFSDATKEELAEILAFPEVCLAERKPDILDILLMSRSKIMMLSQSSTFSYWAAFLSNALVIIPSNDWQKKIKDADDFYREIKWDAADSMATRELEKYILQKYECGKIDCMNKLIS